MSNEPDKNKYPIPGKDCCYEMNQLPDYIRVFIQDDIQLYVNRRNNQVLRSDDFPPEVLVAIGAQIAVRRSIRLCRVHNQHPPVQSCAQEKKRSLENELH